MWDYIRNHKRLLGGLSSIIATITLLAVFLPQVQVNTVKTSSVENSSRKAVITIGYAGVGATGSTDYSFTGTADNVPFASAILALPANGGEILVTSPASGYSTINFATTVNVPANVTICGAGNGTSFAYNGSSPIFTAAGNGTSFQNLKTDAGGINMGATTGWLWSNININGQLYATRTIDSASNPTGRTASYVIAASDSPDVWLSQASKVLTVGQDLGAVVNTAFTTYTDVLLAPTPTSYSLSTMIVINGQYKSFSGVVGGQSYIKQANGANLAAMVKVYDVSSTWNNTISNLSLDGNKTNQTGGAGEGIYLVNAGYSTLQNINVSSTYGNGIERDGNGGGQLTMAHVIVRGSGGCGFVATQNTPSGIQASNCDFEYSTSYGISLANIEETQWTNTYTINGSSDGWHLSVADVYAVNNQIQDNAGNGIYATGGTVVFSGGQIRRNGLDGFSGTWLYYPNISNFTFVDNGTLNGVLGTKEDLYLTGGNDARIIGNTFFGTTSGGGHEACNIFLHGYTEAKVLANYCAGASYAAILADAGGSYKAFMNTGIADN